MSHALRLTGKVEAGRLVLDQPERLRGALAELSGKLVEMSIGRRRQARSMKQNSYVWAGVYPYIAAWSGHSSEEIHEAMKGLHCPQKELVLPSGEVVMVRSTRLLSLEEFSEYVSKVKGWAAEQNLCIPDQDEVGDL